MKIPREYLDAAARKGLVRVKWKELAERSGLSVQHTKNVIADHPRVSDEARARVRRALGLPR